MKLFCRASAAVLPLFLFGRARGIVPFFGNNCSLKNGLSDIRQLNPIRLAIANETARQAAGRDTGVVRLTYKKERDKNKQKTRRTIFSYIRTHPRMCTCVRIIQMFTNNLMSLSHWLISSSACRLFGVLILLVISCC